ncbi:XrtA system polysaccharide chain length determinant [Aliikangiella sp. IMCC44653]
MNQTIANLLRIIKKEVWDKKTLVTILYVFFSALFLAAAWFWPRIYTSTATVLVDEQNILRPLMAGTAVTTDVTDRAKMANQIIFSQRAMKKIISTDAWAGDNAGSLSPKEFEGLSDYIRGSTRVSNAGKNLIQIEFKSDDANTAYETAKQMTRIFIDESLEAKREESRSAYEFIDNQVAVYHEKLKSAETAIKEFRSKHIDATPGAKANANVRLIELNRELETVELEISTQESSMLAKQKQLAGESGAASRASIDKERQLNLRISGLETQLDTLRLNYKDTYPDIVQIKGQIDSLKAQIVKEIEERSIAAKLGVKEIPTGAIARELKSQILAIEANISTLNSKRAQLLRLIDKERNTLDMINSVEAEISELTRDYEVNQTVYQELLSQRENARISMNIDINNQGMTLKVQEPASLPVTPKGVRFSHIIIVGLIMSFLIPIGVVYGLTILDQKVRNESIFADKYKLPVLGSVYAAVTEEEKKTNYFKAAVLFSVVSVVWIAYGYTVHLRMQG